MDITRTPAARGRHAHAGRVKEGGTDGKRGTPQFCGGVYSWRAGRCRGAKLGCNLHACKHRCTIPPTPARSTHPRTLRLPLHPPFPASLQGAKLCRGRFTWVTEAGSQERYIVATAGRFSVTWNFKAIRTAATEALGPGGLPTCTDYQLAAKDEVRACRGMCVWRLSLARTTGKAASAALRLLRRQTAPRGPLRRAICRPALMHSPSPLALALPTPAYPLRRWWTLSSCTSATSATRTRRRWCWPRATLC
jgi:hypothetical protein